MSRPGVPGEPVPRHGTGKDPADLLLGGLRAGTARPIARVRSGRARSWRARSGLVGTVLGGGLLLACGGGQEAGRTSDSLPKEAADRLDALAAAAPLIVVAEVTELRPGRTVGEGEAALSFQDVRLAPQRVLKGSARGDLLIEQVSREGRVVLGSQPLASGDRVLLFLRPSETEEGRHVPLSEGRYRLEDDILQPLDTGPLSDAMAGRAVETVIERVRATT